MDNMKATRLDESMDSTSVHSNKAQGDDGLQIMTSISNSSPTPNDGHGTQETYRLYKRRYLGLVALVWLHI